MSMGIPRIAVLGHGGVGKTNLITRYINGKFTGTHNPTLEDNYRHLIPLPDGSSQIVEIIDTAGTLQFPAMRRRSIETATCYIVVYSKECEESVTCAREILDEIYEIRNGMAPVILVANKMDMSSDELFKLSGDDDSDTEVPTSKRKSSLSTPKKLRKLSTEDRQNGSMRSITTMVARSIAVMQDKSAVKVKRSKSECSTRPSIIVGRSHSTCQTRPSIHIRAKSANQTIKSRLTMTRSDSECERRKEAMFKRSNSACHDDLFASYMCHLQSAHKDTSAKLNRNVESVFRELAAKVYFQNQVDDTRGWKRSHSIYQGRGGINRSHSVGNFHSTKIVTDNKARRATTNVPPLKPEDLGDVMRLSHDIDKKTCCIM